MRANERATEWDCCIESVCECVQVSALSLAQLSILLDPRGHTLLSCAVDSLFLAFVYPESIVSIFLLGLRQQQRWFSIYFSLLHLFFQTARREKRTLSKLLECVCFFLFLKCPRNWLIFKILTHAHRKSRSWGVCCQNPTLWLFFYEINLSRREKLVTQDTWESMATSKGTFQHTTIYTGTEKERDRVCY